MFHYDVLVAFVLSKNAYICYKISYNNVKFTVFYHSLSHLSKARKNDQIQAPRAENLHFIAEQ